MVEPCNRGRGRAGRKGAPWVAVAAAVLVAGLPACVGSDSKRSFLSSCGTADECESNLCIQQFCTHTCSGNDGCGGAVCLQSVCVPRGAVPCADDASCTTAFAGIPCVKVACGATGRCQPGPLADGVGCQAKTCGPAGTCSAGACQVPAAATGTGCDDAIACTSDSCDPKSGCLHTAIDGRCDDGKPCTLDACQLGGGCKSTSVASGQSAACYSGAAATKDVGPCHAGTTVCDGKGGSGPCNGQVVPLATDGCAAGDGDCDGKTDEDCGVAAAVAPVCGGGQSGPPGSTLPHDFIVRVTDGDNAPVAGAKVAWSSPDGATFATTETTTNASGLTGARLTLGLNNNNSYTGRATLTTNSAKVDFAATANQALTAYTFNFGSFCDPDAIQFVGVAALESGKLRLVTGGDSQTGAVWRTKPLAAGTSLRIQVDVSGFTAGYSLVLQSTANGLNVGGGGYADQGTPALNPSVVAYISGSKGAGSFGPASLNLSASGKSLASTGAFLPTNQNQLPKTLWLDYDHPTTSLRIYVADPGAAKPANPVVTAKHDIWATLAASGKPIYAGFTAGNSSAGVNGTKYVEKWSMFVP